MSTSPRIQKLITTEEWAKITELGSFFSIYVSWDKLYITLNPSKHTFKDDMKALEEMGFHLVPGKTAQFTR